MVKRGKLSINLPRVNDSDGKTTQEVDVTFITGNVKRTKTLFYQIPSQYKEGLCSDLSDAYVIGVVYYCMKNGLDIESDLPMSSHLHHALTEYIIPALVANDEALTEIDLLIPIKDDSEIRAGTHVGTGMSCGVDSMHSLWHYKDYKDKSRRLTHLCITDVGAFNSLYGGKEDIEEVKSRAYERARTTADYVGLPLLEIESNIQDVIIQSHITTHTYTDLFSILMMRYFWRIYYYSSSGTGELSFDIVESTKSFSGHYDMFTLPLVSDGKLDIFSEGFITDHYHKLKDIQDVDFVHKFLYSCLNKKENCGVCTKCLRNLWNIDALGKLDSFREVYDIDWYIENRRRMMYRLVYAPESQAPFLDEARRCFEIIRDPDYLHCLDVQKTLESAAEDYSNGVNLERSFKLFEKYRHPVKIAYYYYGLAKIEGKGTEADVALGRRVMESDRLKGFAPAMEALKSLDERGLRSVRSLLGFGLG